MKLGVDAAVVDGRLVPGDVTVEDDRIVAVGGPAAGTGATAVAGFVDLQVNGFAGVDLLAADDEAVRAASSALLDTGVTAWQPTLITSAERDVTRAAATIGRVRDTDPTGARILGIHLEGPFLAPGRLGTHPDAHRRDPDVDLLDRLCAAGPVTYVTLAPELPGALGLVDRLRARGIVVSAGHTDATAAQAHAGFDRGIATTTHLANAMRRFTPREPGIVGAALTRPDVTVQVIVDGWHLAPETVRLVWAAAPGRVALVTDAVAAAGLGDGVCQLGEIEVTVADGAARRADGTLAGSVLTMPEALRNLVDLGVPLPEAVAAATSVPAAILGRDDLGRLHPGARADVVVLDDELRTVRTLLAGRGREVAPS